MALVRLPIEALVGTALLVVLPTGARRWVAGVLGGLLGVLTVLGGLDLGFYEAFARPFDAVLDWSLLADGGDYLTRTYGTVGGIALAALIVIVAVGVVALITLSALRLSRAVVHNHPRTLGVVAALTAVWLVVFALGLQIVPGVPVASDAAALTTYNRATAVAEGLRDRQEFAAETAADPWRGVSGGDLLTALHGKDVLLVWVESYGEYAISDPRQAAVVDPVLDEGTQALAAAGFSSRTALLTSSTVGGGSWRAHATLESGLWVDNQQRYLTLIAGDRFTLSGAFHRAGWRTVSVQPANTANAPETGFYGYDANYDARNLGYHGPRFNFASIPDQYTLWAFQNAERAPGHTPVMASIVLLSSHSPWTPLPSLIDWSAVDRGPAFASMPHGGRPDVAPDEMRADYAGAIKYSLATVISYARTYGDDNLVIVMLGDHQPAPIVTGPIPSHNVPISIIARDPTVLDRVADWNWSDGLRPGASAPVWPMDSFRDRFLTAFGPRH
jgi:sulfatase-like protein